MYEEANMSLDLFHRLENVARQVLPRRKPLNTSSLNAHHLTYDIAHNNAV